MAKKSIAVDADKDTDELNDAAVRWQSIRIGQLGFTTNILVGLAAGLIALDANLAFGKLEGISIAEKQRFVWSIFLLLASITFGILLAFNRLYDFRKTYATVLLKIKRSETTSRTKRNKLKSEIAVLRTFTRKLGRISHALLVIQSLLFLAGVVVLYLIVRDHLNI